MFKDESFILLLHYLGLEGNLVKDFATYVREAYN